MQRHGEDFKVIFLIRPNPLSFLRGKRGVTPFNTRYDDFFFYFILYFIYFSLFFSFFLHMKSDHIKAYSFCSWENFMVFFW